MIKYYWILFCTICINISNSQEFVIVDNESKKPVPFAAVKYIGSEQGTYTNAKGVFNLEKKISDSIVVSSINYITKFFNINTIKDSIFLNQKTERLKEVIIPNKANKEEVGLHKKSSDFSWHLYSSFEFIVLIENSKKFDIGNITKIHIPIKRRSHSKNTSAAIRINLYSINEDNDGAKKIHESTTVYHKINKNRVLTFDISEVILDSKTDKIYIGLEFLGFIDESGNFYNKKDDKYLKIPLTKKKSENFELETFVKVVFSENDEWKSLNEILKETATFIKDDYNLPIGFTINKFEN